MLHRRAITDYLARERDNFNWIKSLSEKELDEEINCLPYKFPKLPFPLKQHQKACFLLGVSQPEFNFWLDMGLGKTLLSLLLIDFYQKTKQTRQVLVIVPTNEVAQSWEAEINLWLPHLPYALLIESSQQKWQRFAELDNGIIICTYHGLSLLLSDKKQVKLKKKLVNKLVPNLSLLDKLTKNIDAIILDETTKVSNQESLWYKICNIISSKCQIRYGLAGRAFGRDPIKLWAQFHLIDRGQTLGPSINFFRAVFFDKKKAYWVKNYNVYDYTFIKAMDDDLARITSHRSIRYSVEECLDLPRLSRIVREVEFPEEASVYYRRIVDNIVKSKDSTYKEIRNAFIRLRQISSGFIGLIDDETGERARVEFPLNPKFDLLMELISELSETRKFVIFYEFTFSGAKIVEHLLKNKIKVGWLWSGTKSWTLIKDKFDHNKDFRGLVVQNKKGNLGLNLQAANYVFFYESPVSPIDREQAEFRVHRQGQKYKVFQYDLILKDSVDQRILQFHKTGNDLFTAIVDDPAKMLLNK